MHFLLFLPFIWNTHFSQKDMDRHHNFPPQVKPIFMSLCEQYGGKPAQCQCAYPKVEDEFTLASAIREGEYWLSHRKFTHEGEEVLLACHTK